MNNTNSFKSFFTTYGPAHKTREEQLAYDLDIARQRLRALEDKPLLLATVLEIDGDHVLVNTGAQVLSVRKPMMMDGLVDGAIVRLRADNPAIVAVVKNPVALGEVLLVRRVIDERQAEVDVGGRAKAVLIAVKGGVKAADRVLLDLTGSSIIKNLGAGDNARVFTGATGVSWDDIGGLEDVKRELREAIEEPIRERGIYARYGRKPTRGILLYGPPGCGKTMLGKAAATALAETHGASARATGFQYVKGPELLNKFVGASEENIRAVFAGARAHRAREGYPAIVFIDEADALMGRRGAGRFDGMERTIVPQFLAEMDGLEDAGAMVLLATNRADSLDPAIVRDGRIDRKIHVRRPNEREAEAIFAQHLRGRPTAKRHSEASLAAEAARGLFLDLHALYMVRTKSGSDRRFALRELVNGAMIAGIVERATQRAIRREIAGDAPRGIAPDDIVASVEATVEENRGLEHAAELAEFVGAIGDAIEVARVKGGVA